MNRIRSYCLLLLGGMFLSAPAFSQTVLQTGVLVVGGGAAGSMAGIQSARMGVKTIIAEPTTWLGGMISSAGVSAFDGNHNMPSGLWAKFREKIYQVYGGPNKVATGWVSNTLFEPHVADSIIKSMTSATPNLTVRYGLRFQKVLEKNGVICGAAFLDLARNRTVTIHARQVIDATELGDVMASARVPFDLGMEASQLTGENVNVPESNDIVQDLTWVAILKDYGPGADRTIAKPSGYDPMEFDGCNNQFSSSPEKLTSNVDAKKMLDYGKLPRGKYMINWPGKGNDIYLNVVGLSPEQRDSVLQKAKDKTLRFLYFLQTQFGFKHLDLADDEFPTADRLALMPYHREGRRLRGMVRMKIQDIADPFAQASPLYRTGIAVGDYPIDHHHRENTNAPQHLGFYPVPSYNIPLGALVPVQKDGLVVAEKGISVSNVVNGTTRLQPVVMLTGQAAGALAALAVLQKKQPRQVSIRQVQSRLLSAGVYLMPYFDVKPSHPFFHEIQRTGATGLLRGKGEPFQWANRTWFYPDSAVNTAAFRLACREFYGKEPAFKGNETLTVGEAIALLPGLPKSRISIPVIDASWWKRAGLGNFDTRRPITRAEMAVLLDRTLRPFASAEVDHSGNPQFFNKKSKQRL